MVLLIVVVGLALSLGLADPGVAQDPAAQAPANPPPPPAAVEQITDRPCGEGRCHTLRVRCADLAPRIARVREWPPLARETDRGSVGTMVFLTGVWGKKPYFDEPERRATLEATRAAGFEVFELWWDGRLGWGEGVEGAGFARTFCAPTEVIRWLVDTRADTPSRVCAQGNSGGALQLAYGLALYDLDEILDLAVLSGGPPLVDLESFCFDRTRERAKMWRENGRRIVDTMLGFDDAGDFCKNGAPDPTARAALASDALVLRPGIDATARHHDLRTRVVFVESEGDKSTRQARRYHEALTGPTEWIELPSRAHGVDRDPETAPILRRTLIEHCAAIGD